jgi:hypothetical protein
MLALLSLMLGRKEGSLVHRDIETYVVGGTIADFETYQEFLERDTAFVGGALFYGSFSRIPGIANRGLGREYV